MPTQLYADYDSFAWLYNRKWGCFAKFFVPDLEDRVLSAIREGASILDLCCGTGNLAAVLSERGYNVTGIDGSPKMLEFARENAPKAKFIRADARDFSMPSRFHAVLSLFDSLNHVMKIDELEDVFRNVFTVLLEKGVFFFDLNTAHGFAERWRGKTSGMIEEDFVYANRTSYESETGIAEAHFAIFRRDKQWERNDVIFYQRCYSEDEILEVLTSVGFQDITVLDASKDTQFRDVGRSFFLARKWNKGMVNGLEEG
ncbi:class I SAM-dependent methyltransferase [bacterium]|nr:class I SAM-dependent methyltransferase [bacterium]